MLVSSLEGTVRFPTLKVIVDLVKFAISLVESLDDSRVGST